ncbi:putative DNA-binding transcriptional regulator YafY [Microbacterium testaceum]|uniref:helix-turn-helix transcriptional regulator n=1 Tax=Microbacterium TaxID=33882 RepID=UPI002780FC77|nr:MULTISPECIES: WYL domain-containing protein [Microbacterium]MDQ1111905.1 putative DNA-binding transcriptional regulator YafY [Microbacterium testaceum]MDR6097558.1 putative DNA-binding transcriptional regulator YafY [Microbacterium sp. SORGH_AS_0454]
MATTSRLLTLLSLLQARRDWPGSVLASRLDVSDRTVRRDIDRLREMGYRIETTMGPDGGYRLDAGAEMPPLLFDDDQALAVALALRAAPALGADIGEAAVRALATMRQVLPSRLRHRLEAVEVTTVGRPGEAPVAAVPLDVLLTLAQAVRDRVTLRFDYMPRGEGEAQPRRIEPHHLVTSDGRWYLLGWDLEREDWRLFSADRVRPRVPRGAPFVPRVVPDGDVDSFVSARFKGSDTNEWPCRGTVLLHAQVRDVLPFAGDGTVTAVDDERCTLEVGSWSWGALAASFGRFEVAMEVVEPPELAEAFEVQAARFAAAGSSAGEPRRGS